MQTPFQIVGHTCIERSGGIGQNVHVELFHGRSKARFFADAQNDMARVFLIGLAFIEPPTARSEILRRPDGLLRMT